MIKSGKISKENLKELKGIQEKSNLFSPPEEIDEAVSFKDRLKQPLSYRYEWALNKLDDYNLKYNSEQRKLKVLDLGCWTGMMTHCLHKSDYNVTAFDKSQKFLDIIDKHTPLAKKVKGDVLKLPFYDNEYDAVICLEVIEHIKSDTKLLEEAKRVLTDKGILILTTPIEKNLMCSEHVNFYNYYQMTNNLKKNLKTTQTPQFLFSKALTSQIERPRQL